MSTMSPRSLLLSVLACSLLALGFDDGCDDYEPDPFDYMLAGDPIDPDTGMAAEIVPGAPWVRPGPDGEFNTPDDRIASGVVGDVDLVLRTVSSVSETFPEPAPLRGPAPLGFAQAHGKGVPVPFAVGASSGSGSAGGAGDVVLPPYLDGLPFLVLAFADLDADGYVGITHLDGDPGDSGVEALELEPVGRRYAVGRNGGAVGELSVSVGGPIGVTVALGAAAFAAPYDNPEVACASCHSWPGSHAFEIFSGPFRIADADLVPEGPAVMTRLPFLPDTDPDLKRGLRGTVPAHPDGRVAVEIGLAYRPDPADPRVGEGFTLRLDGSDPSIDVARVWSGSATRFGLAIPIDGGSYVADPACRLRPGLDEDGLPRLMELCARLELAEPTGVRVVALDALGNVTWPAATSVTVRTGGGVTILPDSDGDPHAETVQVLDVRGTGLTLHPPAGGPGTDRILVEGGGGLSRVDVGPRGASSGG